MSIKVRLIIMNFLQFFVWGSWLISLGGYMGRELHFEGAKSAQSSQPWALPSLIMPGIIGIIADKWFNAERLYGLCHIIGAACLFYASTLRDMTRCIGQCYSIYWYICLLYHWPIQFHTIHLNNISVI